MPGLLLLSPRPRVFPVILEARRERPTEGAHCSPRSRGRVRGQVHRTFWRPCQQWCGREWLLQQPEMCRALPAPTGCWSLSGSLTGLQVPNLPQLCLLCFPNQLAFSHPLNSQVPGSGRCWSPQVILALGCLSHLDNEPLQAKKRTSTLPQDGAWHGCVP